MKRLDGFITREICGKTVAVAVGERTKTFNGMITLNGTALFLWNALETDQTVDTLTDALLQEYDVTREKAAEDVAHFLAQLQKAGVLQ